MFKVVCSYEDMRELKEARDDILEQVHKLRNLLIRVQNAAGITHMYPCLKEHGASGCSVEKLLVLARELEKHAIVQ